MLVRFDHVASRIVNANQSIVGTAEKLRVADCVVRFNVQEPTECQRICSRQRRQNKRPYDYVGKETSKDSQWVREQSRFCCIL